LLTVLLRYIYQILFRKQYPIGITLCFILLFSLIVTPIHVVSINFIYAVLIDPRNIYQFIHVIISTIWNLPVFFGWSILYFGIKYWYQWNFEKDRAEKANLLAQSAQLQMLRYQLNPHFLFNSLNSIRALINEDQKTSREMISELSEFLRYSLVTKNYSEVPLSHELEAMQHYFSIEKKRFEEKLEVNFDINREAEKYPVLSFILHPLVENAVKYGMMTTVMPLRIRITANVIDGSLFLKVSNTGKWISPGDGNNESSTGTGLRNISTRLENAYPGKHKLDIGQIGDSVVATIELQKRN
jgi:two-component system LytT family sensor kinase